ncbi:MAG: hypothetical protein MUF19_00660 [Candidatus Pacebacteria bacterium]|jgi:hypothetical protein|nr:hypothetical protein [Candidatus Paceibacterota bacterium]
MKEDILQSKLRSELSNLPIDTEARVLYLLVEMRKVLEYDEINHSVLRFYGDWVVHTKLDRAFSQRIYEVLQQQDTLEGQNIISFNTLKNELREFLNRYDLPTDLIDINEYWTYFREKLIDVLVDVPIVRKKQQVVGTFEFQRRDGEGVVFRLKNENGETLGRMFLDK